MLFGISKSAAGRVVDNLAPFLALSPVTRRHGPDTVLIVDGTLVPTHDRVASLAASAKNCWHSPNLQVVIDAKTRLVVAVATPTPGNGPNCASVVVPYRKPRDGTELPTWKQDDLSTVHRRVRARVEHTLVQLKNWNIQRKLPPQETWRLTRREGRHTLVARSTVL